MPKRNKLYCSKTLNLFIMQFGFTYPVTSWNTRGRKDTRTKEHGKQRKKKKKNAIC